MIEQVYVVMHNSQTICEGKMNIKTGMVDYFYLDDDLNFQDFTKHRSQLRIIAKSIGEAMGKFSLAA